MSASGGSRPSPPQEPSPSMIFGMPKSSFWLTLFFGLLLYVSSVTDVPDKICGWALSAWIALTLSTFFLVRNSQIPRRRIRLLASVLAPLAVVVTAFLLLRPQYRKAFPSPIATPADVGDETSRIEHQLGQLHDSEYRQLVASVIYAFDKHATLSVGSLVDTPDGTRTVDIEVRSPGEGGVPFLLAVDVLDLASGRKADITFVDAADSKRAEIKADATLLCSNTGFEQDAISKAKRKHIGLISVLRQGDNRVKAVIEEEIYLRKIDINPVKITWNGDDLQNLNPDIQVLEYGGGSVAAWAQVKAFQLAALNPEVTFGIKKTFNFKAPTDFYKRGKRIRLRSVAVSFVPHTQWFSETARCPICNIRLCTRTCFAG